MCLTYQILTYTHQLSLLFKQCDSEKKQPSDTSQSPWQHMEGVFEAEISVLIAGGENTHRIGSSLGWREAEFNIIESGLRSSIMWFLGMLSPHRPVVSWRKVYLVRCLVLMGPVYRPSSWAGRISGQR